jgi:hypothetical protein
MEKTMKKGVKRFSLAVLGALCLGTAAPAAAVEVKAGSWDLSLTGNVNAFATYQVCGVNNDTIAVGLPIACTKAKDAPNTFSIESGLLPSAFVFTAKTRAFDLDVSATIGLYPGLHVADTRTGNASDGRFSMDVRQNFLTFGDEKKWGTIKLGKDLGIFGADAILSDMTLLGVGSGAGGLYNHNVTIGHIGTGYIYADWIPQIAYISPKFSGAQLTVAAVEAFRVDPTGGNDLPGVQAKVSYDFPEKAGRIWAGGMYQNSKTVAPPTNPSLNSVAGELGAKYNVAGLGAMAYGYYGKGIGSTLIGLDSNAGVVGDSVEGRKSYGFLGQVTYEIPNTKLKPGLSYGMSFLDKAGPDTDALLKSNAMVTAALFYAATETLTLVAEFDHVRSKDHAGGSAKSNSGALGAIIFF